MYRFRMLSFSGCVMPDQPLDPITMNLFIGEPMLTWTEDGFLRVEIEFTLRSSSDAPFGCHDITVRLGETYPEPQFYMDEKCREVAKEEAKRFADEILASLNAWRNR